MVEQDPLNHSAIPSQSGSVHGVYQDSVLSGLNQRVLESRLSSIEWQQTASLHRVQPHVTPYAYSQYYTDLFPTSYSYRSGYIAPPYHSLPDVMYSHYTTYLVPG